MPCRSTSTSHRSVPARRLLATAGAALALAASAAPAAAQTAIGFDGLTTDGTGVVYLPNYYITGGLQFSIAGLACGAEAAFASWGPENPLFYTGSPALFNNSPASATVNIAATNGQAFSLFSVDMAPFLGSFGNPTSVLFMGMLMDGGTVSQEFMVPGGTNMLTSYMLDNFAGLSAASFTVTSPDFEPYVQIDNLSVSVVPEPATVTMLGLGLALMGGMAWRRRRATLA